VQALCPDQFMTLHRLCSYSVLTNTGFTTVEINSLNQLRMTIPTPDSLPPASQDRGSSSGLWQWHCLSIAQHVVADPYPCSRRITVVWRYYRGLKFINRVATVHLLCSSNLQSSGRLKFYTEFRSTQRLLVFDSLKRSPSTPSIHIHKWFLGKKPNLSQLEHATASMSIFYSTASEDQTGSTVVYSDFIRNIFAISPSNRLVVFELFSELAIKTYGESLEKHRRIWLLFQLRDHINPQASGWNCASIC
jgi:hypothetical protein